MPTMIMTTEGIAAATGGRIPLYERDYLHENHALTTSPAWMEARQSESQCGMLIELLLVKLYDTNSRAETVFTLTFFPVGEHPPTDEWKRYQGGF
jgi:hypothetical protein